MGRIRSKDVIYWFSSILLLLFMASPSMAQNHKSYQGSHVKNRKQNGGKKHNGVGKNIKNRKTRKQVKTRSHTSDVQHQHQVSANKRANKGGKHHSQVQVVRKKKTTKRNHYGGRYPSSKNQFGTKLEGIISVGGVSNNSLTATQNSRIDNVSIDNNLGIHLSGGLLWHINNNLGVQLDGSYVKAPKNGTNMNLYGGNVQVKWNIISYNNKFSPFLTVGGNVYNWEYQRKDFSETIEVTNPSTDEQFADVVVVKRNVTSYTSGNELLYGVRLGIGVDYKINQNIGTFVQVGYNYNQNLTKNNIKINFNNGNMYFNVGVKISLVKNKSLY